jgi:hypothetical protein
MAFQGNRAEKYANAINSSNLRDDPDKPNQTDALKRMAWAPNQFGAALLRLAVEYDSIAKPRPLGHDQMVKLALTYKGTQKEREQAARAEADKWLDNERALFLPKLATLPAVVDYLAGHASYWQISEPRKRAGASIAYWLDQTCSHCSGRKFEVVPDSPSLSATECKPCQGTGKKAIPYGQIGLRLVGYLNQCSAQAS